MLSAAELQQGAVRGSVWTVLHVATSTPVAFVANAVVARALGVTGYGQLAILTLVLSVATPLSNAGVSDGVIQWGAAAHARGDRTMVDALLRRSLGYHLLVQLPILAATVGYLGRHEPAIVVAALLLSVALPVALGSAALSNSIENKSAGAAQIAMVSNLVVQAVTAVTAVLGHSAPGVWATRALAGGLLLPLNFLLLDRARRRAAVRPSLPLGFPAGFWRFALLTAAGSVVGLLVFSRSELLVLDWRGYPGAAGLFALAFGLSQQVSAPIDALVGPLAPAVAGLAEAHPERAREALVRSLRISGYLGAAVCSGLPLILAFIPVVYGASFQAATGAFLVLGVTSCLQSVVNPLLTFNRARKRSDVLLRLSLGALVVDLVLAFALIPHFGLWGAVTANIGTQVAMLTGLVLAECRAWTVPLAVVVRCLVPLVSAATVAALWYVGVTVAAGSGLACAAGSLVAPPLVVLVSRLTHATLPAADVDSAAHALPRRLAVIAVFVLRPVSSGRSTNS